MLFFSATTLMAQTNYLTIAGTVTDTATGLPIPNHPVYIDIDSATAGFTYHHIVMTIPNGFYVDTVFFNTGAIPSGTMGVKVYDCMQVTHMKFFAFYPGTQYFGANFSICTGTPPPCHADFSAVPSPPPSLTMHFNNLSVGTNGPWFWSFGDGASSANFDPNHTYAAPGLYTVTLSIGDSLAGCWDYESKQIHVGDSTGGGCHAQFTWYIDSVNVQNTVHFVNQSLPDSAQAQWDFGDGGSSNIWNPSYVFATPGVHHVCLTITTASPNCTSTECHDVVVGPPPPPPCESWFTHMTNWMNVSFEGHMLNNPPATYSWSFGDGTSGNGKNVSHQYTVPGIYDVTLSTVTLDSNQCTWSSTQQIQVGDSNNIHQVYGQVFAGNFPLTEGMAMIFGVNTPPNVPPFFAAVPLDSMGIYYFAYVPAGEFVIWALPFDSTGGYLPTFYGNVIYWEQATVINLGQPANPYNISLVQATNMATGNGGINGQVNTSGLKTTSVDQITMLLMNEQGQAVGYRKVSASGSFDFSNMAFGTYYLKPELPNTTSDQVKVVLSAANPIATVNMTYSGQNILGIAEAANVESFVAYPNPVADVLNLNFKMASEATVTAEVYSFTGQVVSRESISLSKGANVVKLDVSTLNSGLYTLRMTSAQGIKIVQKFVKK